MEETRNEEMMEMSTPEANVNPEYYDCESSEGGMAKGIIVTVAALAVAGVVAGRKKLKAWNKKRVIAELEKEGCTIAYPVADTKSEEPVSEEENSEEENN